MDNTTHTQETCTLCGLTIEIDGFSVITQQGTQKFCCAGCLSIYQLLNDNGINQDDSITSPITINHEES